MVQARSNSARRGWVFGILGVAAVAAGVSTVWNQLPSISAIAGSLVDAHPGWSLAALGAQVLAVLSFAEIQRRLVTDLGGDLSRANSVELTLASGAISMAMPAGSAFGAGYTYRRLRRTGLRPAGIGVALVASAGLLTGTLILLYAVLAGPTLLDGLSEIIGRDHVGSLVVLVGAVILLAILKPRRAADRPPVRERSGRISGYVRTLTAAARSIPPGSWQSTALWAVVKWAADFAVLVSATLAVGADVDVIALATVYLGIQVLRQIPLTPGGVGIIEAALLAGLIAAGAAATPAAGAVVIYRLLTFWLILPAGGVAALLARRTDRIPPAVSAATVLP